MSKGCIKRPNRYDLHKNNISNQWCNNYMFYTKKKEKELKKNVLLKNKFLRNEEKRSDLLRANFASDGNVFCHPGRTASPPDELPCNERPKITNKQPCDHNTNSIYKQHRM